MPSGQDYIKRVLGLLENFNVESMIAFSFPDEDKKPDSQEQLEYEKILKIDRRARDSDRATDLVKDPAVMSA